MNRMSGAWLIHYEGLMQERVPTLTLRHAHLHPPSNQFYDSSHCISLSLLDSFKITTVFSFSLVLLIAFHQSHFFLLFLFRSLYSPTGFLPLAVFQVHPRTHTHIHSHWSFPEWNSVTPRWVFGSVQTAMGWEKNSPCRVWTRRQTILVAACAKKSTFRFMKIGKSAGGGLSLWWWCVGRYLDNVWMGLCKYDIECLNVFLNWLNV